MGFEDTIATIGSDKLHVEFFSFGHAMSTTHLAQNLGFREQYHEPLIYTRQALRMIIDNCWTYTAYRLEWIAKPYENTNEVDLVVRLATVNGLGYPVSYGPLSDLCS